MSEQTNPNTTTGISNFISGFARHYKVAFKVQIFLVISYIIGSITYVLINAWYGTIFSSLDKLILCVLGICQILITLALGIYNHHTKTICSQLYDEHMDIIKYKYSFLVEQHQHTIKNTLNFNRYMMLAGFVAITVLGLQSSFTLFALNYWSSTALYAVILVSIVMLLICIGVPFAFNAILKLSHHYLFNTNGSHINVLGKTIAFAGLSNDPNIISPRYYQVIRQIVGNGQHSNYVIQKITIIDQSSHKYDYQVFQIEYLKELKDLISTQDFKAVESALLKNGIHIV